MAVPPLILPPSPWYWAHFRLAVNNSGHRLGEGHAGRRHAELRLSLDCARLAVRGDDFAPALAAAGDSILRADAAAAFVTVPIGDGVSGIRPRVVVSGGPPVNDIYISDVIELAPRHPHTGRRRWFDAPTTRLSDLVDLRSFWETDMWLRLHGYVNGRYQSAANLGCYGGTAAFLVVQRAKHDFSDDRTDITVGGVPVTGLKISEAASRWEQVYNQPIELEFQGNPILLKPADIGFRPKSDLMEQDMRSKVGGTDSYWSDFWNFLWQRPTSPVDVELRADYQEAKLRDFLQDLAKRYEVRASGASFDTAAMTFGAGLARQRLDIDASMETIDKALRRPTNRKVTLIMKGEATITPILRR